MAWNGSNNSIGKSPSQSSNQTIKQSNNPTILRGLLAGLLIVVLGGAALWYFAGRTTPHSNPQTFKPSNITRISEATPAPAATPVQRVEKPKPGTALQKRYPELNIPDNWDKPYPPQAYRADGSLKRHSRYVTVYTNRMTKSQMPLTSRTFSNIAERDIASTLLIEPGNVLVGDYVYGEKFVADFLDSLKNPSPEDKDDTEEQKTLRSLVAEAKKELKAAYDRGEDIAKIMNETRAQFKELGLYKMEIQKLVDEARRNSKELNGELTPQDERDLIEAANKMLEERGCKPLELPETFVEKATHNLGSEQNETETENEQ